MAAKPKTSVYDADERRDLFFADLCAEYEREVEFRGLPKLPADEALFEMMADPHSKHEDIAYLRDFIRRCEAREAEERSSQ
jgi:hypothetical protein